MMQQSNGNDAEGNEHFTFSDGSVDEHHEISLN